MPHAKSLRDVARALPGVLSRRKPSSYIDRPFPKASRCVFCGGTPLNREHIWPAWSHRYIPKETTKWYAVHAVERTLRTDIRMEKHPGDPIDRQVRCVDERCNNGWMRRLEEAVRPIIVPLFTISAMRRIPSSQQATIAAWIVLKAIVSEYQRFAPRVIGHKERKRFWKKRVPSQWKWKIWIARYDGRQSKALWIYYPFLIVKNHMRERQKSNSWARANGFVLSYVFGKLFIHVLYCPHEAAVRLWRFPAPLADKLRQIWPPTEFSILWPTVSLTDLEAHTISRAFKEWLGTVAQKHRAP